MYNNCTYINVGDSLLFQKASALKKIFLHSYFLVYVKLFYSILVGLQLVRLVLLSVILIAYSAYPMRIGASLSPSPIQTAPDAYDLLGSQGQISYQ